MGKRERKDELNKVMDAMQREAEERHREVEELRRTTPGLPAVPIQKVANRLYEDCHQAHRGAFWWDEGKRVAIAFGNDGYSSDPRSQGEVAALRVLLKEWGGIELGFATEDGEGEGYGWALACRCPSWLNPDVLEGTLWFAWNELSEHRDPAAGDVDLKTLNWDYLHQALQSGRTVSPEEMDEWKNSLPIDWEGMEENAEAVRFKSVTDCFTGVQANIARAALERAGLL
jgi:hypothetical protein